MRQGQQNRRGRGRGNNNNNHNNNNNSGGGRKGQNPLTRSFESNGPEMKIRGTPAHVAEKYMSLARDALASSDPVLAENYLQHAEHYNRIILTYREQQLALQNNDSANGSQNQRNRQNGNGASTANERADQGPRDAEAQGLAADQPDTPQPVVRSDDAPPRERPARAPRTPRQDGSKPSRSRGGQRSSASRSSAPQSDEPREAEGASDRQPESRRQRDRFGDSDEQPQFLRRPVRRSRAKESDDAAPAASSSQPEPDSVQPVTDDAQD